MDILERHLDHIYTFKNLLHYVINVNSVLMWYWSLNLGKCTLKTHYDVQTNMVEL